MSASTPAAPKTIVAAASEWGLEAFFWLRTSGLRRPRADRRGKVHEDNQAERDSHVNSIKIYPGDTTVRLGEHLMLSAVSFDSNGVPVGGVKYQWQTNSAQKSGRVNVSEMGEFVAYDPGVYIVTVQGAGRRAQATIKVGGSTSQACEGCAANMANEDIYDWNSSNYKWASDPINECGNPPDRAGGAGSGNFQFTAPVLSLPGRGLSLDLNLVYNSRVWAKTKVNNVSEMTFDIDKGVPAVGWSFGFNKIINLVDGGAMIVDADGTRHGFTGTVRPGENSEEGTKVFTGSTTDGTLVDYACYTDFRYQAGSDIAKALYPNGTIISYFGGLEPSGARVLYPAYIQDSNGNYQTFTYHNHNNPANFTRKQIATITDTLGRVVIFHYDSNDLLTAVTAAGLPDANGNPTTRTLIRIHYKELNLDYGFAPMPTHVRSGTAPVWVIDAIYYPATNSGYWFGDTDSYSSYGMIRKVEQQRGMGFSTSTGTPLNEQGTVTAGLMTNRQLYNYPLVREADLSDAPDYTTLTETWEGQTTGPAITSYDVRQEDSPRTVTVTAPDNTRRVQYAHNIPEGTNEHANDGLVFKEELYDANNSLVHKTLIIWHVTPQGEFLTPPRPDSVEETDERGQMIKTEYSYGPYTNPVTEVREFGYDGNLGRKTVRTYINLGGGAWPNPNPRLLNLISSEKVYAGDGMTLVSHTAYRYDEDPNAYPDFNGCYQGWLVNAPGVVNHNNYYDPYFPYWFCGILHLFVITQRGNVTSIVRYPDVNNEASAITESRRYDITGNLISASTSCCEQTSATYEQATQYAYPVSQSRGSSDPNSLNRVTTSSVYDFNTGLTRKKKDANGRETTINYSLQSWRPQEIALPSGAQITYEYDDVELKLTETSRLSANGAIASQSIKYTNGRGNVRQEKALAATDVWDVVDTEYDSVNRISRRTSPYRAGDPQRWTTTAYDALNRVTRVTGPDGSKSESYYNEVDFDPSDGYVPVRPNVASTSAGRTLLVRDLWGRERWGRSNSFGRLVEVVEPNPSGTGSVATGGLLTTYTYNALGNLTTVNQGEQTRWFKYDALGRLLAQKLAETSATLNDTGNYVGINGPGAQWSDFFTYDARSNITSRTDARGVKSIYSFDGDPLNRLQSVSWDLSGPHQELADSPILPAAAVSYQYRTKNNASDLIDVTQISSVTIAGMSTESYAYDPEGRVAADSLIINGRPAMDTNYDYDSLDRVTYVTYPKRELGVVGSSRKVVHFEYDVASRVSQLTVDDQTSAGNIVYNAASQTKSLKVGEAGPDQITENYGYDSQTGLLTSQNLIRGGDTIHPILDLSYDYAGANGKRTGQLTKLLNNLNHNKDRSYTYDALGRLIQARGGQSGSLWTQTYTYDQYGNRTSVTASGSSASLRTGGTGLQSVTAANRITAENPSVLRQMNSESEPGTATGSFGAIAQPSDPRVSLPTDQLSLRTDAPRSTSSHHASRTTPATPQGGPPVFTDPDLLAPGGVIIKTLHITELRNAINDLRAQRGFPVYSWQTSVTGLIKADPIVEMRTALDQVLGPPTPGYSSGLAQFQPILAIHIQELRNRVVADWNAPVQIPVDGHANLSYDTATNRITTAGFAYDAAGNQVRALIPGSSNSLRFQYDAANRLVNVKADDNVTVLASYTYGCNKERLVSDEGGFRTYYVATSEAVIAEYVETGGATTPVWSKSYVYLGARLLSTATPNGSGEVVQYHHPDRLGTRLVTNPATGTSFEQVTLPFGGALNAESTGATNRRFTSYDRSAATGLDYAINRHYDSQQGRFTQVDPIGMSAASLANPESLNMYSYCGNDPVNRVDPDGQFWGALFSFFASLFRSLRPNTINISFRYRNLQPIGFSFSPNFRNMGASYGSIGIVVRSNGTWLPTLRSLLGSKNDSFGQALTAARGILSGNNDCATFFEGAGLNALNGIADAVLAAGDKAYTVLDDVKIGISMKIPVIVPASSAPVVTTGLYGYVSPMSVAINSRGAFGMQSSFGTLPRFGGYAPGSLQARVLQLLHETGHLVITDVSRAIYISGKGKKARVYRDMYRLTHLLPLDGGEGNEDLSSRNTRRVLRACRSQIDALRN